MLDLTTEEGIQAYLNDHLSYDCYKVERLPEGFTGFVYRAWQQEGLTPPRLIVKHVEAYAARSPNWKVNQDRMNFEFEALQYLSRSQHEGPVRVPKPLHYDDDSHVLVMEDAGEVPSLKTWFQPGRKPDTVAAAGEALGRYLAFVHNASAGHAALLGKFDANATGKYISGAVFFAALAATAAELGFTGEHFEEAGRMGKHDVDTCQEVLTLGDYWTGNVLISEAPELQLHVLDLEFAKPGSSSFDIGQMAAEMYFLAHFRDRELGYTLLEAFLRSYRASRKGPVDVAKVAVRVGAHFFMVAPRTWSDGAPTEHMNELLVAGADLIKLGAARDDAGLRNTLLKSLC